MSETVDAIREKIRELEYKGNTSGLAATYIHGQSLKEFIDTLTETPAAWPANIAAVLRQALDDRKPPPPWDSESAAVCLANLTDWAVRCGQFTVAESIRDAADVVNGKQSRIQSTVKRLKNDRYNAMRRGDDFREQLVTLNSDITRLETERDEANRGYSQSVDDNHTLKQQLAEAEAKGEGNVVAAIHEGFDGRGRLSCKMKEILAKFEPETMNHDEMLAAAYDGKRVRNPDMPSGHYITVRANLVQYFVDNKPAHVVLFCGGRDRTDWVIVESEASDEY